MLNKLISLVFLFTFLNINVVYSESNFLLPQKKPSIFKKSEKQINEAISKNLPVPKPKITNKNTEISNQKLEETIVENKVTKSNEKIISSAFVFPKRNRLLTKFLQKKLHLLKFLIKKILKKLKKQ